MPLSKSHSSANKINRVPIGGRVNGIWVEPKHKRYHETELIIDEVYADMANGKSKSDILKSLTLGNYRNHPMTKDHAYDYYNAAMDRFAVDCDEEADRLRKLFYGRYEALLEDAIKKGDIYNARGVLDSMARIFGIEKKAPDTAIQINGKQDGSVVVNFGFTNNNDESAV